MPTLPAISRLDSTIARLGRWSAAFLTNAWSILISMKAMRVSCRIEE